MSVQVNATTLETVKKAQAIVLKFRRLTFDIAEAINIFKERATYFLSEELGEYPPGGCRFCTLNYKLIRMQISCEFLERFPNNKLDFMRWNITTDETWVCYYGSKRRHQQER